MRFEPLIGELEEVNEPVTRAGAFVVVLSPPDVTLVTKTISPLASAGEVVFEEPLMTYVPVLAPLTEASKRPILPTVSAVVLPAVSVNGASALVHVPLDGVLSVSA